MVELRRKDKNTEKQKFEDNDRVVANMNVDGMPLSSTPRIGFKRNRNRYEKPNNFMEGQVHEENNESLPELDKKVIRQITFSATLAGLIIGAVFLVLFFLFIMFCIHIWF